MDKTEQVLELENRISQLEQENLLLKEKVDFLSRKLFGRSTEKTSSLGIEGQMSLFDEAEVSAALDAVEPDMNEVASYRRKKFKGQREELLKDIPHEKKLCTLSEEDRFCEECGSPLYSVGEEFVRTEIEFIPAKHLNAGNAVKKEKNIWRNRPCRIRLSSIPMPPHLRLRRSSIRNTNWLSHCTDRKRNGKISEFP